MLNSKTPRENQIYEDYWKLTMEYTDFKSYNFNIVLKILIDYIDKYNGNITSELYQRIQQDLDNINHKSDKASHRKAINQFLKLGFINNGMKSYHKKAKDFLLEKDMSRKKRIYSEILYDNASFSRSFKNDSNKKELNFLIKTLEFCGSLNKDNLLALMYQNVDDYTKGYVNLDELNYITDTMIKNKGYDRKYNQVSYLFGICKNILSGVYINKNGDITLDKDEQISEDLVRKGRDPYKQRLYKYDLYRESLKISNKIICYFEKISYPVLIASHIKPYNVCNEDERFDVENGLLLSKNIDQLFDQGWISFNNDGTVILSKNLDSNLKEKLSKNKLDTIYLQSKKRLEYLKYHREHVFDINKNKEYII